MPTHLQRNYPSGTGRRSSAKAAVLTALVLSGAQAQDNGDPIGDDDNLGVIEETLVVIDNTDDAGAIPRETAVPATELAAVEVIATTPAHGVGLPKRKIPYPIQTATATEIQDSVNATLPGFMNERLGSVTINDAQNNPLQPDLQYRGFTASPLLGLPQGLSVYMNGSRMNDAFGDAVNWDLISESAIHSLNLMGGSNPVFGLNTLGGALSLQMKNGFTDPGYRLQALGGSFGRIQTFAEAGWNNGSFGAYLNVDYFDEGGWRDHSPSTATNLFGSFGWRGADSALDLDLAYANTDLTGNGPLPRRLLVEDRSAVFTYPDTTDNESYFANLSGEHWLSDLVQISANVFYRHLETDSFNGDAGEFQECDDSDNAGYLCEEGSDGDDQQVLEDLAGNPIPDQDAEGNPYDAINNVSSRDQDTYGANLQTTFLQDLFGRENQLIVGLGYFRGDARFDADVELARLLSDRGTAGSGIDIADGRTRLKSKTRSYSIFFLDTLSLTDALDLTLSGRYNDTKIENGDQTGDQPQLNGSHDFSRFNPAIGLTYQLDDRANVYTSYSESSRAPTPVELACSDPENECRLPNAFLADPPLEQVVAKTFELGIRGELDLIGPMRYSLGLFHTINNDDIIFQAGGATGNRGFFDNIGDTRRQGIELGLNGQIDRLDWFLNYSYLDATFRNDFFSNSPNNPNANDDGNIQVSSGDQIPGIPNNSLKTGLDYQFTPSLRAGFSVVYASSQYYRGDESNQLPNIPGYTVVNLHGEYRVNDNVAIIAKVNNLFDTEYSSFGLLGEADEVLGDDYADPRFDGPGAPFGAWIGIRASL